MKSYRVAPISAATSSSDRFFARYSRHNHRRYSPMICRIPSCDTTARRTVPNRFVHFRRFFRFASYLFLRVLDFSLFVRGLGFADLGERTFTSFETASSGKSFSEITFRLAFPAESRCPSQGSS